MVGLKDFQFTYETYQDVRHNLFKYSIPILAVAGFFTYFLILSPDHRTTIDTLLSKATTNAWMKGVTGMLVFGTVAFVLTEIIQVHDKWYDTYVIRWRYYYAIDFILPRLVHPFASQLSPRFYEVASENVGKFQEKLYYPFVGDRDGIIGKNKILRFYEVITIYWLTQINEIVVLGMVFLVGIYKFVGPNDLEFRTTQVTALLTLIIAFVLNRMWASFQLKKVRAATADEIDEILSNHREQLKEKLIAICTDYKLPFDGL